MGCDRCSGPKAIRTVGRNEHSTVNISCEKMFTVQLSFLPPTDARYLGTPFANSSTVENSRTPRLHVARRRVTTCKLT
jgi:hypothetical protein